MSLTVKIKGKGYEQLKRIRKIHDNNPRFNPNSLRISIT